MKIQKIDDHLKEKLKDPYFRELYELEEQKLSIVKRVIDYRIKNKVSQNELAARAGVTQQHISKIESGEFSSIATLQKILLRIGYTVQLRAIPLTPAVRHKIEEILHPPRKEYRHCPRGGHKL